MTDQELFLAFLGQAEIPYEENIHPEDASVSYKTEFVFEVRRDKTKVDGYTGFSTLLTFDKNGKFYKMWIWE